jgi:hypothetical protein
MSFEAIEASRQPMSSSGHPAFVLSLYFEQIIPYAPLNCRSHNIYRFYALLSTEGVARYRGEPALYPYYRDYENFLAALYLGEIFQSVLYAIWNV